MHTLSNRWAKLALLYFARATMAIQFQSIPPLVPFLIEEWDINYTQIGLLIGLFMTAGIFLALPGGLLGQWFGDKAVVVGGLALMTAGTFLFAMASSYPVAFLGRLIGGVGVVLLNVQSIKMTTDWFAGKEIATAMGILLTAWPLGIGIALSSLGFVATVWSWQAAIALTGVCSGIAMVLIALLYRGSPAVAPAGSQGKEPPRLWTITRLELVLILSAALVWMIPNSGFIVFIGFAPAMLVSGGMAVAAAGFVVSLASWMSIGTLPLGGWLTDRTKFFTTFIVAGVLGSALAFYLAAEGVMPLVWVGLFGICLGLWPGAVISMPSQILSPSGRNTGFGVFYTVYYVGMATLPPIAGWLQDSTGNPKVAVLFAAFVTALTVVALLFFRMVQHRLR
ncbi:MAG: MFS transporter [SAR324 cluster bacterium]|nr:MFS transporter [SAR324 cluster bacterium]